jgi:hypothetical protein
MKSSPLNTFLTYALVVSLLASLLFCFQTVKRTREIRQLAVNIGQLNQARGRMQVIVGVCMEYAKTNASLDSILESVKLDPKAARATAAKAAK